MPFFFYLCGPYLLVLTSISRCWSLILTGPHTAVWHQSPVLKRTPSSVLSWFLNFRKRVIWLESHFWHHVLEGKHYESSNGQIQDVTHYLFQKMSWERGTMKTPRFKEQLMFKVKYRNISLGQTGTLCSLYWRHFLKSVHYILYKQFIFENEGLFLWTFK